jgi:hypothetical protein
MTTFYAIADGAVLDHIMKVTAIPDRMTTVILSWSRKERFAPGAILLQASRGTQPAILPSD